MRIQLLLVLFLACSQLIFCQENDVAIEGKVVETEKVPDSVLAANHSPKKAALLSLIPGGGQIYNRKYWKVPVIYGLGGAAAYFSAKNYSNYRLFRETLISRVDSTSDATDNHPELTQSGVESEMEKRQKNFELLLIATIAVYALQIVDATVDAHLMYFDVSDDLTLQVQPKLMNLDNLAFQQHQINPTIGLSLKLHIR